MGIQKLNNNRACANSYRFTTAKLHLGLAWSLGNGHIDYCKRQHLKSSRKQILGILISDSGLKELCASPEFCLILNPI